MKLITERPPCYEIPDGNYRAKFISSRTRKSRKRQDTILTLVLEVLFPKPTTDTYVVESCYSITDAKNEDLMEALAAVFGDRLSEVVDPSGNFDEKQLTGMTADVTIRNLPDERLRRDVSSVTSICPVGTLELGEAPEEPVDPFIAWLRSESQKTDLERESMEHMATW
jgi:hypothetical protein